MTLHIHEKETDALVRELATRRGLGPTEAVREPGHNELAREKRKIPLRERLNPILYEIDALPK